MSVMKPIVRFFYLPFMLLGLTAAAYFIVSGAEHHWGYLWLIPLILIAYGAAHIAERTLPWYEEWNEPQDDDNANIAHIIVYEIANMNGVLLIPVIVWLFPFQGIWPTEWPLVIQWLMALVIADFVFTYVHLLSHKFPFLWRLHAVHHGAQRLYGFNGLVRHPLHQTIDMVVGTMPLVILGMPVDVAVLLGFTITILLIVQHSNVAYALGPLRNWMSIGRIHHMHHVNWGAEGDCNFGLMTTAWDRMFGTFVPEPPRTIHANDMGVDELPHFPKQNYLEQLLFPFIYKPGEGEPERYRKAKSDGDDGKPTEGLSPAE